MSKIRFKDYLKDYLELNNITNKDFALRLGITQKHLIDILSGKEDLSSSTISKISIVTNIPESFIYGVESNYKMEYNIEDYLETHELTISTFLNKFSYKFLIKSEFMPFTDKEDKIEIVKDILKYLRVPKIEKIYELDNGILYKSKNDKPELLALWLEKCYKETLKQDIVKYSKENITLLIEKIKKYAIENKFVEKDLICDFNKLGIYLVIEDDIPGSKIRGAFKVHKDKPAIYLTKKHKRIADIYFALLHELAHCKSDFNKAKASSFVSFDNEKNSLESKADKTAFEWMVDDDYYFNVVLKPGYNIYSEKTYPKSFIVYRLANDGKIKYESDEYQFLNITI